MNIDGTYSIYLNNTEIVKIYDNGGQIIWEKGPTLPDYFYIQNISSSNGSFKIGDKITGNTEYSFDGTTWTSYDFTNRPNISVSPNQKLYLRSTSWNNNYTSSLNHFSFTQKYNIGGNILSLSNYTTMDSLTTAPYGSSGFGHLFVSQTNLSSSSNVNFGNVTSINGLNGCFSGCSNMTNSPNFSKITTISGMSNCFNGCSKLVNLPNFSNVITINSSGLSECFKNCTSMTNTINLSKLTTIGSDGLSDCFYGCSKMTKGSNLSKVTSIDSYGLESCYYNCSKLATVYTPNISSWDTSKFNNWLYGAGSGVTTTKNCYAPAGLSIPTSNSGIPSGWNRIDY